MRPLKRPMFKYGGDVKKQGIMHGMNGLKDGGPATMADATMMARGGRAEPQAINTVGSPLAPRDNSGRQGYAIPLLAGIPAAITALRGAGLAARAGSGIKNFYQAAKRGSQAAKFGGYKPLSENLGFLGRAKNIFGMSPGLGAPMASGAQGAGFRAGSFLKSNPLTAAGLAYGALGIPRNTGNILGAVGTGVKKVGQGIVNQALGTEFGKEKPPEVVKKTGDGTRGSRLETTTGGAKELTTAERETKDKERLNKIYKLLGVDRAQRNAASKALVDVSRYIDEGGKDTISKKNIGSTISKAISSFDKRLDKADQLKEAAGVMMAKNYLEGGDKVLDRNLKEAKLRALNKEADPSISNLKAVYKKAGVSDAAGAAAKEKFGDGYGGSIMSTKDFNKQMKEFEGEQIEEKTILDIATNAVANLEAASEGGKVSDGYYKVGENIVLVTGGVAQSIVG